MKYNIKYKSDIFFTFKSHVSLDLAKDFKKYCFRERQQLSNGKLAWLSRIYCDITISFILFQRFYKL